jgi:hypothetical protein
MFRTSHHGRYPVNNNNVNGINWVEFQFDQIIDV